MVHFPVHHEENSELKAGGASGNSITKGARPIVDRSMSHIYVLGTPKT